MQFTPGENTTIDCEVTVTYGAGWRVSDRDSDQLIDPNADDANLNFDQWDMINNKATIIADIDIQHKNFGVFVRPKAFYDHVYKTDNANESPFTNNAFVAGLISESDKWHDEVEDAHGSNAEILDLFAYATFDIGSRLIDIRVGKQVISWGESLMISGGISSAQSPVDLAAAVAVGTEVKEIFLPTESVYVMADLTDNLALGAFYQWKWEQNRYFEGGTFFATSAISDGIDEIGAPYFFPWGLTPRGEDIDADDSGQYGVALTYVWQWLNATEFGLYFINYHDKGFNLEVNPFAPSYHYSFTEDIKLYGASFSSQIGDANVSGEFSYRKDYTFGFATGNVKGNYWQAQTSWIYGRAFNPIADQIVTLGEIACLRYIGMADDVFAWKYVLAVSLDWYQVLRALDVKYSMTYSDVPSGTSTDPLGFVEGIASGSVGFDFTYKTLYKASIKYENRFNSRRNRNADRDSVSLKLSYTF
jgi:hypothetical protein